MRVGSSFGSCHELFILYVFFLVKPVYLKEFVVKDLMGSFLVLAFKLIEFAEE